LFHVKGKLLLTITLDESLETLDEELLFDAELEVLATRDIEIQLLALVAHRPTSSLRLAWENAALV
jgi:hypothetical protein